jgi:hypothetical protein
MLLENNRKNIKDRLTNDEIFQKEKEEILPLKSYKINATH